MIHVLNKYNENKTVGYFFKNIKAAPVEFYQETLERSNKKKRKIIVPLLQYENS